MAQVDEIVDVIQDAINANVSDGDQIRMIVDDKVSLVQGVVRTQQTRGAHQGHRADIPNHLGRNTRNMFLMFLMSLCSQSQLEKRLSERGQFFVGDNFTWADLHLYFFCTEDFLSPTVS